MKHRVITFCGHKDVYESEKIYKSLKAILTEIFLNAQNSGQSLTFLCGHYGNFDTLSAKAIDEVRGLFPQVSAEKLFITPYITLSSKERNDQLKKIYDDIVYPPIENTSLKFAISKRNEWMIEQADTVISYVTHGWGGAYTTQAYAIRKKKHIIIVDAENAYK